VILECPRCWIRRSWRREDAPQGPGTCSCGSYQLWRVLPDNAPPRPQGFVRVLTEHGWQELHGPHWRETRP